MACNSANITGNITRDARLANTPQGVPVLEFSVAVNDYERGRDDGWSGHTSFIDCALFGRRAEAIAGYLTKGRRVSVQGRLRQSRWIGDDGARHSRVTLVVSEIDLSARADVGAGPVPAAMSETTRAAFSRASSHT